MDWQETGSDLREIFQLRQMQGCRCKHCLNQGTARAQSVNYWIALFSKARRGDPSELVEHLRSRRKITRHDRLVLAELLEGEFTGEHEPLKANGRPKRYVLRSCATSALIFYKYWKELNRRHGINDWGLGDQMKDYACGAAIELYGAPRPALKERAPTFEEVRTLMERPATRRGREAARRVTSEELDKLLMLD
jgi:hypothetical protein